MRPLSALCLSLIAVCASCVTAAYEPPTPEARIENYTRTIDKPFDETWEAMISYASSTFFEIRNFEKESGLLTLAFGSSDPGQFVDGGHWKFKSQSLNPGQSIDFEGNYVDFLAIYRNGKLDGRMNVFLKPTSENRTEVVVKARYVVTSRVVDPNVGLVEDTWAFNSGGSDTVAVRNPTRGTEAARTLRPTYKAENSLLAAVEEMR